MYVSMSHPSTVTVRDENIASKKCVGVSAPLCMYLTRAQGLLGVNIVEGVEEEEWN